MINKESFYKNIRVSLFDKLTQAQVEGMEAILNEWDKGKDEDLRNLAYMLATVYHETARTMQPIEEFGKGKGRDYGKWIQPKDAKGNNVDQPYGLKMTREKYYSPDKLYYGRGFVQLTWYENYQLASKKLKCDLLNFPELALQLDRATEILFKGMYEGWFTGRKLSQYIGVKTDFIGARKIINGTDKASTIASYANGFLTALK